MLWENLKAKLPMDAEYSEIPEFLGEKVKITDMIITEKKVEFDLVMGEDTFMMSSSREHLTMRPVDRGLLIECPFISLLLLNKDNKH